MKRNAHVFSLPTLSLNFSSMRRNSCKLLVWHLVLLELKRQLYWKHPRKTHQFACLTSALKLSVRSAWRKVNDISQNNRICISLCSDYPHVLQKLKIICALKNVMIDWPPLSWVFFFFTKKHSMNSQIKWSWNVIAITKWIIYQAVMYISTLKHYRDDPLCIIKRKECNQWRAFKKR